MSIIYEENSLPNLEDFFTLFESTGWNEEYGLDLTDLYLAIGSSWRIVTVYDDEKLVGFGRVISDGILHALITEMIVLPEYQGRGIGKEILKMLTDVCAAEKIRDIQLFSAKGKSGFYEKYGFTRRPENAPGMEIKYKPGKPLRVPSLL
jgi:ribosomal protein S18 acetylase RimI-like enzyme